MEFGGAEIRTIEIMDQLNDSFDNIYFFTTSGTEGVLANSLKEKGYKIIPCNIYSFRFPFFFVKQLKEHKINIVHSHISIVSGYIVFLAFLANVKRRIVHFRSSKVGKKSSFFQFLKTTFLKMFILLFSTDILAVNKHTMKSHFANYNKIKKCEIIYNGLRTLYCENNETINLLKNQLSIKNDEKVIIHIGRFHEAKNHYKILNVFLEYLKLLPNSKLLLIGNYHSQIGKEIIEVIKKQKLDSNVLLLGVQSDIKRYLSISDALLFPSLWEGLPGVVLESLAAGVPVLCSDIGCNREIAETNKGIILMDLEKSDHQWATKLYDISKNGKQKIISMEFEKSPYEINKVLKHFKSFYN